jgi:hypothetical protein
VKIKAITARLEQPSIAEIERALDRDEVVEVLPDGSVIGLHGAHIVPVEEGIEPIRVDVPYLKKHRPQIGGYFVLYDDGYMSFSPAKAFEDGYTRIDQ